MPPKDITVNIIKVPLSNSEKHKEYPQVFKLMPLLYLELIENKAKIKQDLINKNYVPPTDITALKSMNNLSNEKKSVEKSDDKDKKIEKIEKIDKKNESTHSTPSISDSSEKENDSSSEKSKDTDSKHSSKQASKHASKDSSESDNSDSESEKGNDDRSRKTSSSENLSERLKELLQKEKDSSQSVSEKSEKSEKSNQSNKKESSSHHSKFTPYDKYKKSVEIVKPVPTLAELEQKGKFNPTHELRDINQIPISEYDEDDRKRELLFKFELLKKSYKNVSVPIPDVTVHTPFGEMQKLYDGTVRRLSLDTTVDNYKNYLIYGFMITEYFFGSFLGFDMAGFTQQQMVNMHSYEKLLIELGEKSYVPSGSKWPVELQLLFLIVVNAGMFIVGKMISNKLGSNMMGMINNMNNKQPEPSVQFNKPKRKMKGPDNLEEIKEINEINNTNSKVNVPSS